MTIGKSAAALALCLGLASAASATTISLPDWTLSSGVTLDFSGWLGLTRAEEFTSTANIQSKRTFSPTDTVKVEFDYISWGGSNVGADGLAIYLFDAGVPNAGTGGHHYSALGYCRIAGGYIGIGLDEYGNFSQSCEGVPDGVMTPNSATLRGPQTANYRALQNFPIAEALDCEGAKCQTRQQAIDPANGGVKRVAATLTPKKSGSGYTVDLSINGKTIIASADYPYAAPASMKLGISASNGSYSNNHEIRNLTIGTGPRMCRI